MIRFSKKRRLMKRFHPEGIRGPFAFLYDMLSRTAGFQGHYGLIARDILNSVNRGRLLDVGAGPGWLLEKIHGLAPDMGLTGLDISPSMTARAGANLKKAGLADRIGLVAGRAGALPFADGSFKAVVSTGSLHHWKNPVAELDEVYRVLVPGGTALIYDMVTDLPREHWKAASANYGRFRIMLLWLHSFEEPFLTTRNLEKMVRESRFKGGDFRFIGVFCQAAMVKPA